jgi:phosphate starvation-inducible membrane PsiE
VSGDFQSSSGDSDFWPADGSNAVIRLLVKLEHVLLYIVAFGLLVVGAAVLVASTASAILQHASWTGRLITSVEGILLFLIIMEIFITIVTHARGGRIQLEFFIVIGVIALVRHILSVVVRLTIPTAPPATRQQLLDLAVDAGAAFLLVLALAIARWSARRADGA